VRLVVGAAAAVDQDLVIVVRGGNTCENLAARDRHEFAALDRRLKGSRADEIPADGRGQRIGLLFELLAALIFLPQRLHALRRGEEIVCRKQRVAPVSPPTAIDVRHEPFEIEQRVHLPWGRKLDRVFDTFGGDRRHG